MSWYFASGTEDRVHACAVAVPEGGSDVRLVAAKSRAGVCDGRRAVGVGRHAALPFVGFAQPRPDSDTTLTFVDHPGVAAAIADASNLQVLTTARLNAPLSHADLADLDPVEHQQIAYWRPNSIGELLFNFWD